MADIREKKALLDRFAKEVASGLPQSEEFIKPTPYAFSQGLRARDLAENALANEVLKNTGLPIPNEGAADSKIEEFLNRLIQERYPEFKDPKVRLDRSLSDELEGQYLPSGEIKVKGKGDIIKQSSDALHEAGHKYDHKVLAAKEAYGDSPDMLKNLRMLDKKADISKFDPSEIYETMAKGHHAEIPDLREGSYGMGALKSMLKSGKFKSLAPLIGGAAGMAISGASEAADTESIGDPNEDRLMQGEIKQAQQEKAIQGSKVPDNIKLEALKLFNKNKLY